MRRLLAFLIPLLLVLSAIPMPAIQAQESSQIFTIPFVIEKTVVVNSSIAKEYAVGQVNATSAILSWQGNGTGNASIYLDNEVKKIIDLSTAGEIELSSLAGNMRIVLDSNALWQGTITIRIAEEFQIRVSVNPSSITLEPGQSTRVTLHIERISGTPRYIALQHDAPNGITMNLLASNQAYLQNSLDIPIEVSASDSIASGTYSATIRIYASDPPSGGGGGGSTPPIAPPWGPLPYSMAYEGWHLAGELTLSMPVSPDTDTIEDIQNTVETVGWVIEHRNTIIYGLLALVFIIVLVAALRR